MSTTESRVAHTRTLVSQQIIACLAGQIDSVVALDWAHRLVKMNDSDLAGMLGFDEVELQCRAFAALFGADCGAEFKAKLGDMLDTYAERVAVAMLAREAHDMREAA
jgi:hypothetical protein